MNCLWTYIDQKNLKAELKFSCTLRILGIAAAITGFAVWFVIRNRMLSGIDWMICFIGFPVIISWFVVLLYSCNHNYHDKAYPKRNSK